MLYLAVSVLLAQAVSAALTGTEGLNDASRIIKCGDKYFWYSTGGGVRMRWTASPQSGKWNTGPDVFPTRPTWWARWNPKGASWAPDVIYCPERAEYHMYYSLSTLGVNTSVIGLAVNTTLDPNAAGYAWVDKGIVISSRAGVDSYNAIDPCPVRTPAGDWYLAFGSHVGGIKLRRLNVEGQLDPDCPTMWNLARMAPTPDNACEAGAIYPGTKNGVAGFWLFVNWGSGLGKGENATYNVRVGWSATVTGPYRDKNDVDMYDGGGSLMMPTPQSFSRDGSTRIGRGHIGLITGEKLDGAYPDWISYSYWLQGAGKRFGLQRLVADDDGWPDDGILLQH